MQFQCDNGDLRYLRKPSKPQSTVETSSVAVEVPAWREMMRVTLLFPANGEYIDVTIVEGAKLGLRDQLDSFFRIVFELNDEPAEGCSESCFVFDTVGDLPSPSSIRCDMFYVTVMTKASACGLCGQYRPHSSVPTQAEDEEQDGCLEHDARPNGIELDQLCSRPSALRFNI
ncbi:MAG: hypothetical protein SGPRY_003651 [Prymnesium sp.]